MDVQAWSEVRPWDPNLKRLHELGLGPLESVLELSTADARSGAWTGIEPGDYWKTGSSQGHEFRIGSYSFWDSWCGSLREALPDRVLEEWGIFLGTASRGLPGGWGPGACETIHRLWERDEPEILGRMPQPRLVLFERCWREFRTAFRTGAQGGIVQIY